jgi:putative flippase GtrA
VAVGVQAQQFSETSYTLTNTCAVFTTNAVVNVGSITLTKYQDVHVQIRCALTAAGTTSSIFNFAKSVDGTTWETAPSTAVSVANAGTTTVQVNANVNVGAAGYLRLGTLTNGDNDGVLTNIVIKYTTKPQRFGK